MEEFRAGEGQRAEEGFVERMGFELMRKPCGFDYKGAELPQWDKWGSPPSLFGQRK